MKKTLIAAMLLAAGSLQAAGPTLEQRLARIERILQNQSLSDIVLQMQRLQQEVQQLRGELELQRHDLQSLESRQRELYLDLDQRLSRSVQAPAEPAAPAPTTPDRAPAPITDASPVTPPAAAPLQPARPVDPAKEKAAYRRAFGLLQQGDYPSALSAFRAFLVDYPGGSLADNAQYWLGETSYVTRDFDTALAEFGKVLAQYPDSAKVPGSLLKMGYIHHEQKQWSKAKELLGRILREYPSSTEAKLAQSRLDRIRNEGH